MQPMPRLPSILAAAAVAFSLAACSYTYRPGQDAPQPVSPQPLADQLNPGLLPLYFAGAVANVDAMPRSDAALAQGRRGPPVLQLDAQSAGGRMWDSGFSEGYAVQLSGLVQLEAGIYRFAALSDDGVRVTIDRTVVVEDPAMHLERLSPTTELTVKEAGWYPITVQYFQVSGSAALRLYYQPPGAGGLLVAPAAILAHRPQGG